MKKALERDRIKRKNFMEVEIRRRIIKSIICCKKVRRSVKTFFETKMDKFPKSKSITQSHNFCNYTSRSHSIRRFFGVERFTLKKHAQMAIWNYIGYKTV